MARLTTLVTLFGVALLISVLVFSGCTPQVTPPQAPAPAPQAPAAAPAKPATAVAEARPAWEVRWENALAAARQEGKIIIYTGGGGADRRTALAKIAKLQGIDAEIITGRVPEFLARISAERRAGLYLWDIYFGGYPTSIVEQGKPGGFLEPLDSALMLPDLTEPEKIKKVWHQGMFPWIDQYHTLFIISLQPAAPLIINTSLVKPEEIKSYRDLLDPKWKGKLVMNDPTMTGASQNGFMALVGLMGEDFVRELAATKPFVLRDQRQQLEWLAQGKVSIIVVPDVDAWVEFVKIGAPINMVVPKEGSWLSAGGSSVSLIKNAPHSNAARIFINLIASKEGQEIYSQILHHHALRLDVSTTHLRPEKIRMEGVKYFDTWSEESVLVGRPKTDKLAVDIFGPLLK